MIARDIFEDLFVLEMTNNHLGQLQRGLEIIRQHSRIVRFNNTRTAIKLQFRDLENFIHRDFRTRTDVRYIRRVTETSLSKADYGVLVDAIRQAGCIPMATPFDEKSVDWCVEFNMPIIKIASADSTDWLLLERIAKTKKPVIASVGGTSQKDLDDMVTFFGNRHIPLAINHCVAAYPHEDAECELNQIDYLRNRYPDHTIGYSSHEHADWVTSVAIAYAKGGANLRAAYRYRHRWRDRRRLLVAAAPNRCLVQSLCARQGILRRIGASAKVAARAKPLISIATSVECMPNGTCPSATSSPTPTCTWRFRCKRVKSPAESSCAAKSCSALATLTRRSRST